LILKKQRGSFAKSSKLTGMGLFDLRVGLIQSVGQAARWLGRAARQQRDGSSSRERLRVAGNKSPEMLENEHPASVQLGVWVRGRRWGSQEGGAMTGMERTTVSGARVAPASNSAAAKGVKEQ
jgi:hypothetical protein